MDKKQVDIYSLSPMQEAMLFHSLYDQGNSYFKQLLIQVEGDFEIPDFPRKKRRDDLEPETGDQFQLFGAVRSGK